MFRNSRLTNVNQFSIQINGLTAIPERSSGYLNSAYPDPRSGSHSSLNIVQVQVNLRFDRLASIILQINGLTAINLRFNALRCIRFHLDQLSLIIFQINGLTAINLRFNALMCIRFHLDEFPIHRAVANQTLNSVQVQAVTRYLIRNFQIVFYLFPDPA